LIGKEIVVPVWNTVRGQGANTDYRVSAFARVRLQSYHLPQQNRITAEFLGFASCGLLNRAPVVDAGPDRSALVSVPLTLTGSVSDDGLPAGRPVTVCWTTVSGPGTVQFGSPQNTNTAAQFSAPGTYVLRLSANDSELSGSDEVVVTVERENQPPSAIAAEAVTDEDTPLEIVLRGLDSDNDALSFSITQMPAHGRLNGTPPEIIYTPAADFNGADQFTFKVSDGRLESSNAVFRITVRPINDAPVADSLQLTNLEDSVLEIELSGSDVEGDDLTYTITAFPTNGILSGSVPTVRYLPATNFFGSDSFRFIVNDGLTDSAEAIVHIEVLPANDPPVINAGADQLITWPTNSVQLFGEVIYDDFPGVVEWVEWRQLGGPGVVTFSETNSESTIATFSQSGIYELQLWASDSFVFAFDELVVTVNEPPSVYAGNSITNTLPEAISLRGFVSDDGIPAGETLQVTWLQVGGSGTVIFDDFHSTNTTATASEGGTYVLRLTATDGIATASSDVTVVMNRAPVVDAGPDQVITNLQTELAGTAFDDGLPANGLVCEWSVVSGPGSVNLIPVEGESWRTTAVFTNTGTYVLRFTAHDSVAASFDEITVHVNAPPVVDVGEDQRITVGETVLLNATVTDDGLPPGAGLTFGWSVVGPDGALNIYAPTNTFTAVEFFETGTYVLRLTADDSMSSGFDELTVTVLPVNRAPSVSVGPRRFVKLANSLDLTGVVTDDGLPEDSVVAVKWQKVSGPGEVYFSNAFAAVTRVGFTEPGEYVLRLSASDSLLTQFADLPVTVRTPSTNQAPLVSAGLDRVVGLTDTVSLQGTVSDDGLPEGAPLSVEWTVLDGPGTVAFENADNVTAKATFSSRGSYVLQLAASDTSLIGRDQVVITVFPSNQPPVVFAGEDQHVIIPNPDLLMASGITPTNAHLELSTSISEAARWSRNFGNPGITGAATGPGNTWVYRSGLSVSDGWLLVAGAFTNAGGTYAKSLARFDGTNWFNFYDTTPLASSSGLPIDGTNVEWLVFNCPPGSFCNEIFNCVSGRGEEVFAGGNFKDLGNMDGYVDASARWDGERWHSWVFKHAGAEIRNIKATADKVYLVGNFAFQPTNATSQPIPDLPWSYNIAGWDGTNWFSLGEGIRDIRNIPSEGSGPDQRSGSVSVTGLAAGSDGVVYVAGTFLLNTPYGIASNIAMWTGAEWRPLGSGIQTRSGPTSLALAENGDLYVTGDFTNAGGIHARSVAQWDGSRWWALGAGDRNGIGGRGEAVVVHGRDVFVAGSFSEAGGVAARNVARWDGHLWLPLGSGPTNGINGAVLAAAVDDSGVYFGGTFSSAGGYPANNIAKWEFPKSPAQTVQLAGRVTDDGLPADQPLTSRLQKVSGPGDVLFGDPGSLLTSARFTQPGQYVLRLTADDSDLAAEDEVIIDVQANHPPDVNAGADQMIGPNEPLAINGFIRDDGLPAGSVIFQRWTVLYGPGTVSFDYPDRTNVVVRFSHSGTYVLRLYANDSQFTASDDVTVVVRPSPNQPPGLYPGSGGTVVLGATRQMNASAWDDGIPANQLNTTWHLLSGPAGVTFDDATKTNATVSFSTNGVYVFQLVVSDSELSSSGNVTITVMPPNNAPPSVNAGPDQTVTNLTTALQGTVSDDGNPQTLALKTYWTGSGPGEVRFANSNSVATAVTFSRPGVYVLTLTAADGTYVVNDSVIVNVARPVVQVNAGPDRAVTLPTNRVQLAGMIFDSTATPSWTKSSGPGTVAFVPNASGLTNTAIFSTNGTYVLRLSVFDGTTAFDEMTVTVAQPGNQAPEVNAGPDQRITWHGPSMELNLPGTVTDEDSPDVIATWSQVRGPAPVEFSKPNQAATTAILTAPGLYVLRLTGTDLVLTNGDDVVVTAELPANEPPHVDAGSELTAVFTNSFLLNGRVEDDALPETGSLTAFWTKLSGPGIVIFNPVRTNSAAAERLEFLSVATFSQPGTYVLRLFADDAQSTGADDVQVVALPSDVNSAPVVDAGFDATVPLFGLLQLDGSVADDGLPENASLKCSWSMASAPSLGRVYFSDSTRLDSVAQFTAIGTYVLRLVATDSQRSSSDLVTISVVAATNEPPVVFAGLPQEITRPNPAKLEGVVFDDGLPAGYPLVTAWSKLSGPGEVTFAPDATDPLASAYFSAAGEYVLRLSANDSEFTGFDEVVVVVHPGTNAPPVVTAGADFVGLISIPNRLQTTAADDGLEIGKLQVSWSKVSGPGSVQFTTINGVYFVTFESVGDYVLRLTADDGTLSAFDDVAVQVFDAPEPVAQITSPLDGNIVTAPGEIIGTANCPILRDYILECRLKAAESDTFSENGTHLWSLIASNVVSVSNNVLGVFDPTLLLNGVYEIRLRATDLAGRIAVSEIVTVIVDRGFKLGHFTMSFDDLTIPVPGLPLQVTRTYDSRAAAAGIEGDFGIGWTMDLRNVRLQKNRSLSRNWVQSTTGSPWDLSLVYHLDAVNPRIVTITFPDGRVEKFQLMPDPMHQPLLPIEYPRWRFVPVGSTRGSLVPAGYEQTDGEFLYFAGAIPGTADLFDLNQFYEGIFTGIPEEQLQRYPTLFQYTSADGYHYLIDEIEGLQSVTDPNGNTLHIGLDEITWRNDRAGTNSLAIAFQRDDRGRITNIVDRLGFSLTYTYDENGNLAAFRNRDSETNGYAYDANHRLVSLVDARGITVLTNGYDASGRLVASGDAFGLVTGYTHDLQNRLSYTTNRLGYVTIREFDTYGNVVREVDPLGAVRTFEYDPNGNLVAKNNAADCACAERYSYDAFDNRITETDAAGNTTTFTYNPLRKILTMRDPSGFTTTNTYDASGNLISTRDGAGQSVTFTYNNLGKVTSMSDSKGTTFYGYDEFGFLRSQTNALGHVTEYTVDANGNLLSQSTTVTRADGLASYQRSKKGWQVAGDSAVPPAPVTNAVKVVMRYEYTPSGYPLRTLYYDGSSSETKYENGKPIETTDALGRITRSEHDAAGRLVRKTYPDGCWEAFEYDAEGQLIASTDKRGFVTRFEYDARGKLVRTLFADGSEVRASYYADGSLRTETSKTGEVTVYGLDENRNRISVTNAAGVTHYTYNYRGHVTSQVDTLNRTNRFEYDSLARQTLRIYPDGSRKSATFTGRLISSETDQNGHTTRLYYDALGRLVEVIDPLGATNRFTYDEQGNRTSATDPLGRTTFFEYDTMGRLVRTIFPDASTMSRQYDAAGRLIAQVNQLGDVQRFEYDLADNVVAVTDPLRNITRSTFDAGGNRISRTDPDGKTTRFEYDALSRLVRTEFACGLVESNEYDLAGRLVAKTDTAGRRAQFKYDIRNQLIEVIDPMGRSTAFVYDAVGNRISEIDAAGQQTLRFYDRLDRLVRTVFPDGSEVRLEYDPAGRVTREIDQLGQSKRFEYDAAGRTIASTDATGQTTRTFYNLAGERTAIADPLGRTTAFERDLMGRVVRAVFPDGSFESAEYDKAGFPVTTLDSLGNATIYEFDANGRRTALIDPLGGRMEYAYDVMGRLVAETDAERNTTSYQYDCMGRLSGVTYADGSSATTQYDTAGNVVARTDANGNITRFTYDLAGRLLSRTDALNNVTQFSYDALGRLVSRTDALGRTTEYHYDRLGRLEQIVYPDGATETFAYDSKGRKTAFTDARGNITSYVYDSADRLIGTTNALGHFKHYEYDQNGRLISRTDPAGRTNHYEYDLSGNLAKIIYADGTSRQFEFDSAGRKIAEIDQAGIRTEFSYDALGRLSAITDALNQTFYLAYDRIGNLVARTDANGRTTRYGYDAAGQRIARTLPGGQVERFSYDANGNLIGKTNFNGNAISYHYDRLNRLTNVVPDAVAVATGSHPVWFFFDAVGNRIAMEDASGRTEFFFDLRDRLSRKDSPEGTISYSRDLNGNVTGIQSSNTNGVRLSYVYDAANQLTHIEDGNLPVEYRYDPSGQLVEMRRGEVDRIAFERDAVGRTTQLNAIDAAGRNLSRFEYILGPAGHRISSHETIHFASEESARTLHQTNRYDSLHRVTGQSIETDGIIHESQYSYDAVGNRLTRTAGTWGVDSRAYSYDSNDGLESDRYDASGNTTNAILRASLIGNEVEVFDEFDCDNRLIRRRMVVDGQPVEVLLTYNGDGERVRKVVSTPSISITNFFLVDDQNPAGYSQVLEEMSSDGDSGQPVVRRVYSIGRSLLAQEQLVGDQWLASYFGVDGHGSVRYLTEKGGAVTDTWDYDAFGNVISRRGSTPNLFLHAGQQFDPDLNLYYLRARYADPDRGRFWTRDPFEGFTDDPPSWHAYVLNRNDSVNRIDPSGYYSVSESMAVSTLAPAVRAMALQIFDGVNHYSHGLGGGSALKATSRAEAYMIDSLAVGPGWKLGKEEFWTAVKGAPFLLVQNPNIFQPQKTCGYECLPFDIDGPIYGPAAQHPIFEFEESPLYPIAEAFGTFAVNFTVSALSTPLVIVGMAAAPATVVVGVSVVGGGFVAFEATSFVYGEVTHRDLLSGVELSRQDLLNKRGAIGGAAFGGLIYAPLSRLVSSGVRLTAGVADALTEAATLRALTLENPRQMIPLRPTSAPSKSLVPASEVSCRPSKPGRIIDLVQDANGVWVPKDEIRAVRLGGNELTTGGNRPVALLGDGGAKGGADDLFATTMRQVESLDFTAGANKAVFYSGPGNRARALAFADRTGATPIDLTPGGQYLNSLNLYDKLPAAQADAIWAKASQLYASGASGQINLFVHGARSDRVFNTIERPLIDANSSIYKQTFHY